MNYKVNLDDNSEVFTKKMNINIGRSCLSIVLLSALVELTRCNENENNGTDIRRGRVNGRIVKLYSGYKPEPVLCLREGFQSDPVDCSVFYRCTKSSSKKYTVFKFQCGPGTVYDPETEVCNHPRNTKRSECGGLVPSENSIDENEVEGHELPSPISTIRPVYGPLETNNITTFTTPSHTEPVNFYLDHNTPTSTSLPVITTTKREVSEISNIVQAYPWTDSRNKTFAMFTTSTPHTNKGYPCTSNGFIGDKNDCRKFYRCISNSRGEFTRYEFSCSESTVWDDNIQSCNHPWAARNILCGEINLNINKDKNTLDNFDNLSPHTEQPQQYGQRVTQNQNYNYNEIYHNKINIENKIDGNAYRPSHQLHNEVIGINKHVEEYPSYVKEPNTEPNHTEIISSTETTRQNVTLLTNYPGRNLECSQTGFMGDSNNCAKFYRCVDNGKGGYTKFEFSCGQGTVWDSKLEACNHAWAVKECGGMSQMKNELTTNIPAHYQTSTTIATNPTDRTTISTKYPAQISTDNTFDESNDSGYVSPVNQEFEKVTSSITVTTISLLSTTTTPATIMTNCRESGFFGDEDDCQKFYRCVDNGNGSFTKYQYECGQGTLWDRNIETCNHAPEVKSCSKNFTTTVKYSSEINENKITTSSTPIQSTISEHSQSNENDSGYNVPQNPITIAPDMDVSKTTQRHPPTQRKECQSTGFIGDPDDCKKFYRCVDNGKGGYTQYEFSCGEGTVWDPKVEACNHAWAVKECGGDKDNNEVTTPSSTTTSDNLNELNNGYPSQNHDHNDTHVSSEPANIDTSTKHTSTTKSSINDNDYSCKASGFFGDTNDCKKFYRCVDDGKGGFTKFEFSCGEGTVWDSTSEICNHEWAVEKCGENNKNELTSTTVPPLQSTTELLSISSTEMQSTSTLVSKTTTQTLNPTTPVYSSSSSIYTKDPAYNKENKCVSDGFFANPHNCKKFYRCVDDGKGAYTKYEFDCGEGTVWVQESQVCDHENEMTKCSYSSTTSTETNKETPAEASAQTTQAINNEQASNVQQVSESEQTDATTKTSTTLSTTVKPKPDTNDRNICQEDGYYGDSKDCKKFYRCVDNGKGGYTKYDFTCGEGTIWDQDISACNHPEDVTNASCSSEIENASSTTSSSTHYISTDRSTVSTNTEKSTTSLTSTEQSTIRPNEVTSEPTSTSSAASESSSNNNETNANCDNNNSTKQSQNETIKCERAGFYPNPNDCKKFYRCVDWDSNGQNFSVYHFECGEGTIWDPVLDTCNHEDSVYPPRNCNGTQQQNENVTEAVTTSSTTQQSTTEQTTPKTTQQTTTQKSTTQIPTDSTNTQEPSSTSSTEQTTSLSTEQTSSSTEQTTSSSTEQTTSSSTKQTTSSSTEQTTSSSTEQTTSSSIEPGTEPTTSSTTEQTTPSSTEQTTSSSTAQVTEQTTSSNTEQTTSSSTEQTTSSSTEQTTSSSTEQTTSSSTEQTTSSSTEQSTASSTEQTTSSSTEQSTSSSTEQTTSSSTEQTTSSSTEQTTSSNTEETSSSSAEQTTTEQSTPTESSTTQVTEAENTTPTTSNQECPQTDRDQSLFVCPTSFRRHPKYCNLFYQCTEDNNSHEVKVAVFNCPNNTIYDENKVQCVEEDKADKKCNGQIAQRHRVKRLEATFSEPIIVTKESLACRTSGHFPFEKHEECSGALLKCQQTKSGKLRGYVYKCPEGFVYWSVSRRCEPMKKVQDCKMKPYAWNKRYDLPVETYNIAT